LLDRYISRKHEYISVIQLRFEAAQTILYRREVNGMKRNASGCLSLAAARGAYPARYKVSVLPQCQAGLWMGMGGRAIDRFNQGPAIEIEYGRKLAIDGSGHAAVMYLLRR